MKLISYLTCRLILKMQSYKLYDLMADTKIVMFVVIKQLDKLISFAFCVHCSHLKQDILHEYVFRY